MECLVTRAPSQATIATGNHEKRRVSSPTTSHYALQKRAQPQRRGSNVGDMTYRNVANATHQKQQLALEHAGSTSSTMTSPTTENFEKKEGEEASSKGVEIGPKMVVCKVKDENVQFPEESALRAAGEGDELFEESPLMASGKEDDEKVPLLEEIASIAAQSEEEKVAAAWLVMEQGKKLPTVRQTWREVHVQGHLGFPIAATNMMLFARFMVSTIFLGKLGGLELAAGTLALTFANVAGWSVLVGLAGGMEAVCSQAHGAGRHKVLLLTLQKGCMILLMASLPVGAAWCKAEDLLLLMGQTPALAKAAQSYLYYLLPDLLATSLVAPLRVFLRSQCLTKPVLLCSLLALSLHVPLNYLLVIRLRMGAPGTALAICITDFALALMLLGYVVRSTSRKLSDIQTASSGSTTDNKDCAQAALTWSSLLKLAVPCCLMTCMEGWCYEIMVLLTGLLPHAKEAVETVAIVLNGDTLLYALEVALASCVCTRVGNELGAKQPLRAFHATVAALCLGTVLGCGGAGWLLLSSRMAWGRFFTKDIKVLKSVTQLLPIMALIEVANFPQNVACGVLRGSARPAMGALINLGAFYVLGIPVAVVLAFKYKMGVLGLWIGLASAAATTAILTVMVVLRTDWRKQTLRAHEVTNQQALTSDVNHMRNELLPQKHGNAAAHAIMPHEEHFLDGFNMKGNSDNSKVDAGGMELSCLNGLDEPLAKLREIEATHAVNKRLPSSQGHFADGTWKLLTNPEFGRPASKSGHLPAIDGHCWEVSMSMMNESMRKCAMLARLEGDRPLPKKAGGPTSRQASSHDARRNVLRKLKLFASQKAQHKKAQLPEKRRTI